MDTAFLLVFCLSDNESITYFITENKIQMNKYGFRIAWKTGQDMLFFSNGNA